MVGQANDAQYDRILSSETIYAPAAQASLLDCIRRVSFPTGAPSPVQGTGYPTATPTGTDVLVAAKIIYFGVGGSVATFMAAIESSSGGWVSPIRRINDGVGRVVLSLGWNTVN